MHIGHPSYDDQNKIMLELKGVMVVLEDNLRGLKQKRCGNPTDSYVQENIVQVHERTWQLERIIVLVEQSDSRKLGTVLGESGLP